MTCHPRLNQNIHQLSILDTAMKQLYLHFVPSCFISLLLSASCRDTTASITKSHTSLAAPDKSVITSTALPSSCFPNKNLLVSLPNKHALAFIPRGGGGSRYDDYDNDDYDYDESSDADEFSPPPSRQRPPSNRRGHSRSHPNSKANFRSRSPPRNYGRRQPPNNPLTQAKDLTQKSIAVATSATISTLKTGGKAAYYLTAPKYVSLRDIIGIWRFDQSIGPAACAANIEFTPQGDAMTRFHSKENAEGYLFVSRGWPRSCTIEFEAEGFQGPGDEVPQRYYYKGSFRRKVADKSVIKISGKIYEVRKGRFGRKGGRGLEIGSFVARRRIVAKDRNKGGGDEIEFDSEYDSEGLYDDDDYDDYDDDY